MHCSTDAVCLENETEPYPRAQHPFLSDTELVFNNSTTFSPLLMLFTATLVSPFTRIASHSLFWQSLCFSH